MALPIPVESFTDVALDLVIQHQALAIETEMQRSLQHRVVELRCEVARLRAERAQLMANKIFLAQHGGCLTQNR